MKIFDKLIVTLFPSALMRAYGDMLERQRNDILELRQALGDAAFKLEDAYEERAEVTGILTNLVALDDQGRWTTVFDADTVLPQEAADYLNQLMSRA